VAKSYDRALVKIHSAVPEYFSWLKKHGERVKEARTDLEIDVKEIIKTDDTPAGIKAGGPDPLFKCDEISVSSKDIERCIHLLAFSRKDLLKLITDLEDEVLDWKPEDEPRSIRDTLQHIARVDWWYISRLGISPPYKEFPAHELQGMLKWFRQTAVEYLKKLSPEQRTRVFRISGHSDKPWPWTATKVLHRFVYHERQHTNYILRLLYCHELSKNKF